MSKYETPADIVDYKQASSGLFIPKDYNFFVKPESYDVTLRKYEEYEKWSKFIQWGRKNPILFAERLIGIEFMDYQKYIFMKSWNTPYVVWCCSRNAGKALALNTRIPLSDGSSKEIKDIQVGDYILGDDGHPTKVINTSEIFIGNRCFKITFDDGETIIADENHLWEVQYDLWKSSTGRRTAKRTKREVMNTYMLYRSYKEEINGYTHYPYSVPMTPAIYYPEQEVPIDPYIYGLWLTMGKRGKGYLMVPKTYLEEIINKVQARGYKIVRKVKIKDDIYDRVKISLVSPEGVYLHSLLINNGLNNGRIIPNVYLYNSIQVREDLLTGIMDGHIVFCTETDEPGLITYKPFSPTIGEQMGVLLRELGIKYRSRKCGDHLTLAEYSFYASKEKPYCTLSSHYSILPQTVNEWQNKKTIINIEEIPSQATKCLYVDNDSHLFLCGDRNTVTHNSILGAIFIMCKTVLIPNHATYILCDVGSQSIEMFSKIEKLTEKAIPSFKTLTDFYMGEIEKSAANTNGFVHNPASYRYKTFNGSSVNTLNGNYDHNRSEYTFASASRNTCLAMSKAQVEKKSGRLKC